MRAIKPYLDAPREQTVGIHIDISHEAATPPGLTVTVDATLIEVEGRRLVFEVKSHDGADRIAAGRHERFIIDVTDSMNGSLAGVVKAAAWHIA